MGRYYRIPADNRDLNYNKYFVEGETEHLETWTTTPAQHRAAGRAADQVGAAEAQLHRAGGARWLKS